MKYYLTEEGFGFVNEITRAFARRAAEGPLARATARADAAKAELKAKDAKLRGVEGEVTLARQQGGRDAAHLYIKGGRGYRERPDETPEDRRLASKIEKRTQARSQRGAASLNLKDAEAHSRRKRQQYKRILTKLKFRRENPEHPSADPQDVRPAPRSADQRETAKRRAS